MKQFVLLVTLIMVLSFADAQSQKITGTLLAKPNKSITVLPNKIVGMEVAESQKKEDDIIQPTRGFVFNKPVIQSNSEAVSANTQPVSNNPAKTDQSNATKPQSSTFNAEIGKSTILTAGTTYTPKPSVQLSSTPGQLIPEASSSSNYKTPFGGILKYEEPPVKKTEPVKPQAGNTSTTNTKEPEVSYGLVYGPPPAPANGLKSPQIQGMYKAEPKKTITLIPVPASELEAIEQQKREAAEATKQNTQPQTQQNSGSYKSTTQLSKDEQLQQDFNHQVGSGTIRELKKEDQLQSDFYRQVNSNPEIIDPPTKGSKRSTKKNKKEAAEKAQQNSAAANDSKYRFAMPVKQSATENIQSIPVGSHVLKDFEETGNVTIDKTASNETVIKSRTTAKEIQSPKREDSKPVVQQAAEKKFNLPAPVVQKQTPAVVQQNEERVAARPSSSNTVTAREDNHKTTPSQNNNTTISGRTDYKFYMSPNGKYTIVFNAAGSSVTVTSFGRVNDFAMPSDGGSGKPSYNYKGLIDAVGSLPLQYNYEGRVSAVGAMPLQYNYNGAIEKVGDTPVTYNYNGTVDKIGNSKISYDYQGNITSMDKNALVLLKQ